MFGANSRSNRARREKDQRKRLGAGASAAAQAIRRRGRAYRPGHGGAAFETLEIRQLLNGSNDLTQEIDNLLSSGTTTGTTTLSNVSIGSFLTSNSVSVTFQNISHQGADWSGTVSVAAPSAKLALGSVLTAQIQGDTQNPNGVTGTYDLNNQPLGQGAYSLTVDKLDATVSNLLTGKASNVVLTYDPGAAAGQQIAHVGSLAATFTGIGGTSATLTNLDVFDNGFKLENGSVNPADFSLGGIVSVTKPSLTFAGVGYTVGSNPTGTIGLSASSASLFPSQTAFTASVDNFKGTYDFGASKLGLTADDVMVSMGQILKADATGLSLAYNPSAASPLTVSATSVDLTSPEFPKLDAKITSFQADNTGLSIGNATLAATPATTPVTLGGILSVTGLNVAVDNFKYSAAPAANQPQFAGTISIGATSASLFPGLSAFSATVDNFHGSYDLNAQSLSLNADDVHVSVGSILDAKATGLSINYNPSGAVPLTVGAGSVHLSSPDFPQIAADITSFKADNTGLSIGSATLATTPGTTVNIGGVIAATGLSVGVTNFKYNAAPAAGQPEFSGTVTIGAGSVSLFPGQSAFSASVTNFGGSYDLNAQALHLTADEADLTVSSALDLKAQGLDFSLQPSPTGEQVSASAKLVSATFPQFGGVNGTITGLVINNDGFSIESASVNDPNTVSYGSKFSITDPTFTFTKFGYSVSAGAQFDGTLSFKANEVDVNKGGTASLTATGISGSLGFAKGDLGHFTFSATTVNAKLGSVLTLSATDTISFDSSPPPTGDIASFGKISAALNLPNNVTISGTGQDFAIDAQGHFQAGPKFGVSLNVSSASTLEWPSWLPVQVQKVAVSWPDFTANPTNFTLDLSASVGVSGLAGTSLSLYGQVQDAIIDVGKLEAGQFPITGLSGVAISAGGNVFGAEVKGSLFLETLRLDANYNIIPDGDTTTTVAHSYLYGGVDASLGLFGLAGVEIRLGLADFSSDPSGIVLLDAFIDSSIPILLDPDTGLAITDLHAGIDFGKTLNPPTTAKDLVTNPDYTPPGQQTLPQWQTGLAKQVASVAQNSGGGAPSVADLTQKMTIDAGATIFSEYASTYAFNLSGDLQFDTLGHILATGTITIGTEVSLTGGLYVNLADLAKGKAQIDLYAEAPAQAPIASVFGQIGFQFGNDSPAPELGTGVQLNGSTDSGSAQNVNLNNTSYTVEFWAKRADQGRSEYVIGQGDPNPANDLQIGFDASNNFVVSQGGKTLTYGVTDNVWHHWAVTFDQTTGRLTIFEDGKAIATGSGFSPLQNTSTTLLVGQSGSAYFNGSVDEVRVWNAVRAASDIQANYRLTTPATTTGLVADWSFGEASGTTAADSSGNGHTLTFSGSPTWALTQAQTPDPGSFSSFTITATGEVDLTLPDLPGALAIKGSAVFTVNTSQISLDLSVKGTVDLDPLGNLISLAGNVHYDMANGGPELYGIFALQTDQLSQLQALGINVGGIAVLRFNTTARQIPETLPLTAQDGTTTSTTFILPADSVSLVVKGEADFKKGDQSWFELQGELDADFSFTTDSGGVVHPLLQVYVGGTLDIGPSSSPIAAFNATGFLQISDAGVAADIGVTLKSTDALSKAGITLKNDTFSFLLNTTDQEVTYTVPDLTDPDQKGTVPGAGTSIDIPAAPQGSSTPQSYLQINGSGELDIENSFDLTGSFQILVAPNLLSFGLNMDFGLNAGSTQLLKFHVQGGLTLGSSGLVAGINLTLDSALPSGLGFSIDASYLLEVNTTGQDQKVGGLTVPAGQNGPYALVHANGDLTVGSFDLHGTFDFQVNATSVIVAASADTTIGTLGSAHVAGAFTVQSGTNAGLFGVLQGSLDAKLPAFELNAKFNFEINTTNLPQPVTFGPSGSIQTITVGNNEVMVAANGTLTVASLFVLSGEFDITVNPSGLDLNTNASLTLNGVAGGLGLTGHLGIFGADAQGSGGLVVDAALSLKSNLGFGIISINATPTLLINTSNTARSGVAANTYEVELLNASANILGFQAGGTLIVGVNNGVFEIDVPSSNPLSIGFFGLGGIQAYGYIKSNGQFSVTGSVGFDLGSSGNELWGSIGVTISNAGFSGSFSGGASVFGVTVGSISGSLDLENGYVHLGCWVQVLFVGFGFDFTLGQLNVPNVPAAINWYSTPATAKEGDKVFFSAEANDTTGSPLPDSGYQWTILRNGQFYNSGSGSNYQPVLGDPGVYTVTLSAAGLTRSSTVNVANVIPTIQSIAPLTGYAYQPSIAIKPSVIDPGSGDQSGGLIYHWTITKNGNAFQDFRTTNTQLNFTPDQPPVPAPPTPNAPPPAVPGPDLYHLVLTVTDTSGVSTTAATDIAVFDPNNIQVNTNQDLPGVQTGPNGQTLVPLRVAMQAASSNGGSVAYVRFAPSLAGQTINLDPTLASGNTELIVPMGVVYLDGSGAPGLTISAPAGAGNRIFYVAHGAALDINDLNLTGGNISTSAYTGVAAGGAIYTDGTVNLYGSSLYNNSLSAPLGYADGGAVYVSALGGLFAVNTTFANNSAAGYFGAGGGAIWNLDYLSLIDDTISGNVVYSSSSQLGSGVADDVAYATSSNLVISRIYYGNIIAGNHGGANIWFVNPLEAFGDFNLIGSATNPPPNAGQAPFITTSADPMLGQFGDHGNGIKVFSLKNGSPAIGASAAGLAVNENYDGRGYARSYNFTQDLGAFQSQPYVVSNTNDSGPGSLREVLTADDTGLPIVIASNLSGQKITLTSGPIEISSNVTVTGPGADQLAIVGNGSGRLFAIDPGVTATFSGLTFSGGVAGQGGAILNGGNLTINNSVFTNDIANAGLGGALYNSAGATLTVNDSTFAFDSAVGNISNANGRGGALYNAAGATFAGVNDTFASNTVQGANLYGTDGYTIVGDQSVAPAYASVGVTGASGSVWNSSTTDARALLRAAAGATTRVAASNVGSQITLDINVTDGNAHQVSLYALDWNNSGRSERFDVVDANTGKILDSRTLTSFTSGVYERWVLKGHVKIVITSVAGANALYSGLFFDPAPAGITGQATYLGADTTTQGNWESYPSGPGFGGAIDNAGTLSLTSSTVAYNTAANGTGKAPSTPSSGGGIFNEAGGVLGLANTIVGDDAGGVDVVNLGTSLGGSNLVTTSTGLTSGVVAITADPKLGALGNNGGPTPSIAPLPGSPAIDMGNNATAPTSPWAVPGRVAWYKGDGNGVDGVAGVNATLQNVGFGPGQFGQAFVLNGANAKVTVPDSPALRSAAFTVGGWFNLASSPAAGGEFDLISKTNDPYFTVGWILRVDSTLVPRFSLTGEAISPPGGAFTWFLDAKATSALALNTWNYLAATFDGTKLTLYVNGLAAGTAVLPYGYTPSLGSLVIGAASWPGGANYTPGSIDDVQYFGRALNPEELQAAMNGSYSQAADQRGEQRVYNGTVDVGSVEAQPFLVTNNLDSGPGSLREAIAEDSSGDGPIVFAPSLNGQTIKLTSGPITVTHDLTINGPGAGLLAVDGGYNQGLFDVTAGNVSISGLTLQNALSDQGGAIFNTGHLTITNSVFQNNTAYNPSGNATGRGGAIDNAPGGTLTVTGSTFNYNYAIGVVGPEGDAGRGGAIYNAQGATLTSVNNTFDNNGVDGVNGFGTDGFDVINDVTNFPAYAKVSFTGASPYTWAGSTTDVRGLQLGDAGQNGRIAPSVNTLPPTNAMTVDINLTDKQTHLVSIYAVDWDSTVRSERFDVVDATTGKVLNSQTLSSFNGGVYLTWAVTGHVQIVITKLAGSNAVISGLFFDPSPSALGIPSGAGAAASFAQKDTTTQGNWKGNFGLGGAAFGGAIDNAGTATVSSTTIANDYLTLGSNSSGTLSADGAGLANEAGATLQLINTIVAKSNNGHDVVNLGTVTGDSNLVTSNVGLPAGVVAVTADPKLGTLGNDGGPTPALALLPGSPAIDAGDSTAAPATDQRGLPRIVGSAVDIGAFEYGAPLTVTSALDNGPGSLRAVLAEEAIAPGTPIAFAPSLAGQTISLSSQLTIGASVTIDATGTPGLVIKGNGLRATDGSSRVISIAAGATVTLRGLTITGGYADNGGGISNAGVLYLQDSTVSGNSAYRSGGALFNSGTVGVLDSTIANNTLSATAQAVYYGGAIFDTGTLSLEGATISGNSAVLGSPAVGNGGGIAVASGTLRLHDSIVAGNTDNGSAGQDIDVVGGTVASLGYNLVGSSSVALASTDKVKVNPLLGPLQNNGGPTFTMGLLPGSPAIDAGDPNGSPAGDQRGFARVAGQTIDIGAYERQPFVVTTAADSGAGSLRATLALDSDGSPIIFAPALAGQTITFGSPIVLSGTTTIDGSAAPGLVLSGGGSTRIFTINAGATVSLSALTLSNGLAGQGGAISNAGTLTVTSSDFTNDLAGNLPPTAVGAVGQGGAIYNAPGGALSVTGTTFSGDTAIGAGAGASGRGGAVYNAAGAAFSGTNDTFTGDTARGGNAYGSEGYNVFYDQASTPAYATVIFLNNASGVWNGSTTDPRAPQRAESGVATRLLGVAYSTAQSSAFTLDVNVTDGKAHNFSLYALDWDSTARSERIDVVDPSSGKVLDSRTISSFSNGVYLTWTITGHVQFMVTRLAGSNAVLSALYFDPAPAGTPGASTAGASFVSLDASTQGNWKGTAGAGFGGAIDNAGTATLLDSTVASNTVAAGFGTAPASASNGAGLANEAGASLSLSNTIVATDAGGSDALNLGTLLGDHNLVMTNTGVPASAIWSTANPKLGPLQINRGGIVPTLAPLAGSPALDAGSNAALASPVPAIPSLVGWWKADGNAQDSSGTAKNGTATNGAAYAPGLVGQAFSLNGQGAYVALPTSADVVGTGAFSVTAWIKTTSDGTILQQRDPNTYNGEYALGVVGGKVTWWSYGNYQYGFNFTSNRAVNDGAWHLVTGVRLANGTGQIFIDGTLDSSQAAPSVPIAGGVNVYIGGDLRDNVNFFKGLIDEVALYSAALTPGQVQSFYKGGSAPFFDQNGSPRIFNGTIDLGAVENQGFAPNADAGAGYTIHAGDSVTFNAGDSASPQGLTLSYSWDINGDGVFGDATGVSPTLTWAQLQGLGIQPRAIPYNVSVKITDGIAADGVITSTATTLTVLPELGVGTIVPEASGPQNRPVDVVDVTFSSPITISSLNSGDVSLTLNGGPNLITGPIQVQLIPGTFATYRISGLAAYAQGQGAYTLSIDGTKIADSYGVATDGGTASWLVDTTPPDSRVADLPTVSNSLLIPVTAIGNDPSSASTPASGLAASDLYVSINNGPFVYWTTVHPSAPTAYYPGQPNTTYAFYSIGRDAAGNVEQTPTGAQASTYVPNLTPHSQVTKVDSSTPVFRISFTASDIGGYGLAAVVVLAQVDGAVAQVIAQTSASSGTIVYQAVEDGQPHTYRFFSVAADQAGVWEPIDPASGVVATASFPAPVPASLDPVGLVVQNGAAERSYVRYVDLVFNQSAGLDALIAGEHVHLTRFDLNGSHPTAVSLQGDLHVVDHAIEIDFGPAGVGGDPNSTAGDGVYQITVDGSPTTFAFERLLGDLNGDGSVSSADLSLVNTALHRRSYVPTADANGDGVVNGVDRSLVRRSLGRTFAPGIRLG